MAKLTEETAMALAIASLQLSDTKKGFVLGELENILLDRITLKLGEESNELGQAIFKSINPSSSQFKSLKSIMEEAGHVMLFLQMLDTFTGGKITKERNKRIYRHLGSPKCSNSRELMQSLLRKQPDILSWIDEE